MTIPEMPHNHDRDPARRLRRSHIAQYASGFAIGVALGLLCIDHGMRTARLNAPGFAVITSEESQND